MAVVAAVTSDQRELEPLHGVEERGGVGDVFEEPHFVRSTVSPPQWSKRRFGSFEDSVDGGNGHGGRGDGGSVC